MSNRVEKPAARLGGGRGARLTLALILLAGTAACTASPRYPINMNDRPGDGGLTPWQPRYPVSAQDAAQNASDRASGSAIPPRNGTAYPTPPASTNAAPVAPPPPPPSDDDAPRPMSSAPVDSSELPPPSAAPPPPPRSGPYIQSELEAESPLLPPGGVLASYDEGEAASSGLMPGVELAALHHRRHHAAKAEADDAQQDEPASGKHGKGKHGKAADADAGEHITLKSGESLDAAAKRLHISRDELMAANGIKDPRRVRAGTVLVAAAPTHASSKSARAEHAGSDEAADADSGEHITLKPGESLDAAAKRLHTSRDELMAANGIKNPRRVRAGTVLKAPVQVSDSARADEATHAGETARAGHAERAERTVRAAERDTSYDVRKGDTLYSIGRRFGKDPDALAKLNGLRSAGGLRAGQTIKLAASDEAPEREGRRHGAAAEATAREIDLSPPDRFTQEAMRKESRGAHLTRRERQALTREDAREQAAAVAEAAPKHRRGGHASDAAAEVAADAAASQALAQSQALSSRSHRRAVAEAEGQATYNPPPPIYHPAPAAAPPIASVSRATNGDADIPPPVTVAPTPSSPAPTTATPSPTASASVATLNAPTYRPNYSPSLGRARPVAPEASVGGAVSASDIATAGKGRFIWPLKGSILAPFGDRGPGQHNDGLDIAAQSGDSVRAAAAGEVVYAGSSIPGFGNLVLVKHAGGWVTAYAHLNRIEVRMRDTVAQGDEIGQAGQTGAVDRPMLHFEVRYAPQATEKARPVDPTLVLPAG